MALDFLKDFRADLEKAGLEEGSSLPPRYWFSTGNYVVNKTLSGSYLKGIPQGRLTCFTGPSGAGKSFLAANAMREAQRQGAHVVCLDSENALDDDFVTKLGVDVTDNYSYVAIDTIPQAKKVVSAFLRGYKADHGKAEDAPKVLIVIDSLDMLMTETEEENFSKGISKGDQGQRNKQLKQVLREFVQAIKGYNISMIVTAQVYKNQDVTNGEGVWIVSDAIKFSLSQIALLTKLKLRDGDAGDRSVSGIRMMVESYKTRFTKPFQKVTIEVPYETGMDPFNGLFDVAVETGIITKKGAWYVIGDGENFRRDQFDSPEFVSIRNDVLVKCEAQREKYLEAALDNYEIVTEKQSTAKSKREAKHKGE